MRDPTPSNDGSIQHESTESVHILQHFPVRSSCVCRDYLLLHLHWCSTTNLLEDDAVADGGQQIVEVELIFAVAQIPAMLLSKFHQSFTKPGG